MGKNVTFFRWVAICVLVKYHQDAIIRVFFKYRRNAIRVENGFQDAIRVPENLVT